LSLFLDKLARENLAVLRNGSAPSGRAVSTHSSSMVSLRDSTLLNLMSIFSSGETGTSVDLVFVSVATGTIDNFFSGETGVDLLNLFTLLLFSGVTSPDLAFFSGDVGVDLLSLSLRMDHLPGSDLVGETAHPVDPTRDIVLPSLVTLPILDSSGLILSL